MKTLMTILATAALGSAASESSAIAAENFQKLSGAQIRAKFTEMQLTDEDRFPEIKIRDITMGGA